MENNSFILTELFIILVMTVYIVFGLFSYYFSLSTNRSEVEKSGLPIKILYWHGIIFIVVFIVVSFILLVYSIISNW